MPERPSTSLDSVPTAGDRVGPVAAAARPQVEDQPDDEGHPKDDSETETSRPVLPLSPVPPPVASAGSPRATPELNTGLLEPSGRRWWSSLVRRELSGWVVSCLFHASLLLLLGLLVQAAQQRSPGPGGDLIAYNALPVPSDELLDELDWDLYMPGQKRLVGAAELSNDESEVPEVAVPQDETTGPNDTPQPGIGLEPSQPIDWLLSTGAVVGGGIEGRTGQARARLLGEGGGTPESEEAVERGLRWLLAHQRDDGSWHFSHRNRFCQGLCRNPGTVASTTGATAIALAPFLGAGYTHRGGEYQDTVKRGLYYLGSRALVNPEGADFQEGTMYAQGLAAIVLSEAYAMTGDPALKELAQGAIDFIDYAQDKRGGGWRYTPGEPGDTTVTGWQLMALKSAQMANLRVSSPTIFLAQGFLDGVQSEEGARYGYMSTDPRNTTTAIGLLCRMYTGWRRTNPALAQGVAYLSRWGPSEDDMYYNYYATQVMRHWDGSDWKRWNVAMREHLIGTQAAVGHEAGSWYFSGGHAESGGRLYNTAMAVMTLEVYYRYMPLYREETFGRWD